MLLNLHQRFKLVNLNTVFQIKTSSIVKLIGLLLFH